MTGRKRLHLLNGAEVAARLRVCRRLARCWTARNHEAQLETVITKKDTSPSDEGWTLANFAQIRVDQFDAR